mgnify:CR=1 FL=1
MADPSLKWEAVNFSNGALPQEEADPWAAFSPTEMTAEEDATTWAQESLDDEALDADDPWAQFTPQAAAPGGALPDSVTDYPTDGNMTNTPVSAFDTYIGNPAASGHNRLRESLHALQAPGFNASDEERAIWATRAADLSRQTDNYRPTGEMADKLSKVAEAKGFTDGVEALWDNPEILVPVIVESFTMFAPALAGTALAGATVGPVGTAIGAGLGSSSLEFAATLTQEMAKAGGDPTDPMAWNRVLKDPKIMHAAYKKAAIRGAVIGSFDTVTAGLAGKMAFTNQWSTNESGVMLTNMTATLFTLGIESTSFDVSTNAADTIKAAGKAIKDATPGPPSL